MPLLPHLPCLLSLLVVRAQSVEWGGDSGRRTDGFTGLFRPLGLGKRLGRSLLGVLCPLYQASSRVKFLQNISQITPI